MEVSDIDNREDVTIKLNANDAGSYYDPVDSNTHTMNFEVDTPWSDYTGGYLLGLETNSSTTPHFRNRTYLYSA